MDKKIGFIGCGNMAQAIIGGIIRSKAVNIINVFDVDSNKYNVFNSRVIIPAMSIDDVITNSDYIFLAVKPQHINSVFDGINADLSNKTFVSILAGVSINYIRELANLQDLKVIRVMPNTPLLVGEGATALCCSNNVSDSEFEFIKSIFSTSGVVSVISESQMNSIININGSTPAYIFLFTMAVMEYAKKKHIDEKTALELFCQTLKGSAQMMLDSGKTPEELKVMVTSPGGTTLEALKVFEEKGFVDIILDAMSACERRAEELGK